MGHDFMIRTKMWLQRLHQLTTTDLENKEVTLLCYKLTQLSSSGRHRVREISTLGRVVSITSEQLLCHAGDAAAGVSHGSDGDGVAPSTQQTLQTTVGAVGLTGDVVAQCVGRHDFVEQSSVAGLPVHQRHLAVAVHLRLDIPRFAGD